MVTYKDTPQGSKVYLDKKHVGDIKPCIGGEWYYQPKSANKATRGERMASRQIVKQSIEAV